MLQKSAEHNQQKKICVYCVQYITFKLIFLIYWNKSVW